MTSGYGRTDPVSDYLTRWNEATDAQRAAQRTLDAARVQKTYIVRGLVVDGMTVPEIARFLHVNEKTVERLAEDGKRAPRL